MTPTRLVCSVLASAALLGAVALLAVGCRWAPAPVPADPGLNAQARGHADRAVAPTSVPIDRGRDPDPEAGGIYARRCARCHALKSPSSHFADEWPRYVRRYGPRAGLHGAERARVLRWLQSHAPVRRAPR